MYFGFTVWHKFEGYYECLFGMPGQPPFLRVRAVLNSEGTYTSCIRLAQGRGVMVGSKQVGVPLEEAKYNAIKLVEYFCKEELASLQDLDSCPSPYPMEYAPQYPEGTLI